MFSSKSKTSQSPSRVSIQEANSHLQMVHQRVEQLETIVSKQSNQLIANEDNYKQELNSIKNSYEIKINQMNQEMDLLKVKIKELEVKLSKQNQIITENNKEMEKLSQIIKLSPNLEKLLKLINSLEINQNNNRSKTDLVNGFCDNNTAEKSAKKSVKYKSDENPANNYNTSEEAVSASSSSTTSGQSPGNNSSATNSSIGAMRKSSTSKLNIARSFNITANFSDDEDSSLKNVQKSIRKKVN